MRSLDPVLIVAGEDPDSLQENLPAAIDQARAKPISRGSEGNIVIQHDHVVTVEV